MRCVVGARARGGEGGTQFVHGGSRMAIDLSLLCRDRARRVCTNHWRQTLLAPSTKRREVFGESHEE